jgi:hypothetical protein
VEVGAESAHSKEGTADTDSGTAELGLGRLNDTAQRGGGEGVLSFSLISLQSFSPI